MEIKRKYLQRYLHIIAIEQLADEYEENGYSISKEEPIGKYQADLVVRKQDEIIVIEVKSGRLTSEKKEAIAGIGNFVRRQSNYKFLVVIATPPTEKKLEISEIESLLYSYILEQFPEELSELATHTRLEEVTDIEIDEINIDGKEIYVCGNGVVSVELQYGSDGDQERGDGFKTKDNFPFEFAFTLEYNNNKELEIVDVEKFEVDNSSFYGKDSL